MAPQTDYEEGTSFYGAVEIAPKMEERLTNRSKTLKLLVGLAFIAVALTAAVFAFTSPVATRSVEAVIDVSPHYDAQSCFCKSDCVNEPGYGKEGVCEVTQADCKDFLGQPAATCTTEQVNLGMTGTLCAACDMVVGANSCWSNPCLNGGLCADRATKVGAADTDGKLGYHCHCKFGWTGDRCQIMANFCPLDRAEQRFCDNGKFDHVCKDDDECKNVKKKNSDDASECLVTPSLHVCHINADCSKTRSPREYTCACKTGYSGDGYQADQTVVAFGSILKAVDSTEECSQIMTQTDGPLVYTATNPEPGTPSYGWLERKCSSASPYTSTGCRNINGCHKECPLIGGEGFMSTAECAATSSPPGKCKNGATCTDTYGKPDTTGPGTFKCGCPTVSIGGKPVAVWEGTFCQLDIDECKNTPGKCGANAKCQNLEPNGEDPRAPFGFKCTCDKDWVSVGYTENVFQACVDAKDCTEDTCKHGGTCTENGDGTGYTKCDCIDGWDGVTCETNINECDDKTHPCLASNHMSCKDLKATYPGMADEDKDKASAQGFKCVCNEHWTWDTPWDSAALNSGKYYDTENSLGQTVGNTCVDYDDCLRTPCSNAATCTNTGKSQDNDWTCVCASGWKGKNCDQDINECEYVHTVGGTGSEIDENSEVDRMHNCLEEAQCYNTIGSWDCKCMDGYFGNGVDFCNDIDDCARHEEATSFCTTDMRACTKDTDCGGVCTVDFVGDGISITTTITQCSQLSDCEDSEAIKKYLGDAATATTTTLACNTVGSKCTINSDLTRDAYPRGTTHVLDTDTQQVNAIATYDVHTVTKFISPAPWVLNKVVFDETGKVPVHQCGDLTEKVGQVRPSWMETGKCVDTGVNSFECLCEEGWTDSNCDVDVAECQLGIDNCDRNAKCTETKGSFLCDCAYGYEDADDDCREAQKDTTLTRSHEQLSLCGLSCSDIDDCIGGVGKCVNGVCRDLGASAFKCTCNVGYTDFKCDADINECGLMTDDCHAQAECTNLPGSWSCKCKDGYVGTGKGDEGCAAINDCAQSPCEHGSCKDTGNAYSCECAKGWKDKHCDHDVNECLQSTASHSCHDDGKCVNTPGSYYCRCVSGFQGDGYTCMDLDDCDPDPCGMPALDETPKCQAPGALFPTAVYTCPPIKAENLGCKDVGANSFQCRVCPGYSAEQGMVPSDINECDIPELNSCSPNGLCENVIGSHKCTCQEAHYDPCICETAVGEKCAVCKLEGSNELCVPGQMCVECTKCTEGIDDKSSVYACPNDPKMVSDKLAYFPADPQFDGGPPTNPGRTSGRGFKRDPLSSCVHSDYTCINIDECDATITGVSRASIVTYEGLHCAPEEEANCIDKCGTVLCECTGGCFEVSNFKCYFGDGQTCNACTTCEDHECESDGPTTTTDRKCVALIPDGKYAVETTSGHTAQCLVMWAETQKVFPERFNWGGESTDKGLEKEDRGMEVADLCENPICGVCDYSGKTAQQNILDGGSAVWVFRHLAGEEYLIMSAQGTGGFRCLGFRAPLAPYPELITWETEASTDAEGTCAIGTCIGGNLCWNDSDCGSQTDQRCTPTVCKTNLDCNNNLALGACTANHLNALCLVAENGKMMDGKTCTTCVRDSVTPQAQLQCAKESSTIGMWSNTAAKGGDDWQNYFCGLPDVASVKSKKAVVWKIRALGQQPAGANSEGKNCHSAKKCSKAKYKSLFVIESMARGNNYECLRFKDGDFSNQANPSLESGGSSGMCGTTAVYGTDFEASLIAQKSAVWKLIALEN